MRAPLTEKDIHHMRIAGRLASSILENLDPYVKVGVSTQELDDICYEYIVNTLKAIPAPLHYKGFPKSICTSINAQVCHGIPSTRRLVKGDIVNVDVALIKDGYYGDTSKMYCVGETSVFAKRLVDITQEALYRAINIVKPGVRLGDIGHVIQTYVENENFSVVRDFCGHGISTTFHESPNVFHFGRANTGMALPQGLTFTIEPMINQGKHDTKILSDGWTVITKDHSLSAQWEHTLLITETGVDILTLREEELELFPDQYENFKTFSHYLP